MNMIIVDANIAVLNLKPFFRRIGSAIKKINDGKTAQKIFDERSITFWTSLVSE